MFCQECGKEMPNDSLFCDGCGAKQNSDPVAEPIKKVNVIGNAGKGNRSVKYCINCGSEMPADSRFCPECRMKQEDATPLPKTNIRVSKPQTTNHTVAAPLSPEEVSKIAKRNKFIGIVFVGALVLCLVIGVASVFIKPTINLDNYLTVTFEGYDTVGRAVVTFDTEKFEEDYEKKLSSKTRKKSSWLSKFTSEEDYIESIFDYYDNSSASSAFLSNCIGGSINVDSGLRNGDMVTYTWECNDDYALETYGYKLKYKDVEYTVEDLTEAGTFDPFDGIDVVYEGVSPDGTASISGNPIATAAQDLGYELDINSGLMNGDTVTVTTSIYGYDDPIEYCISNYGMIPSPLEKTFTVEGLESYIGSVDNVSDESLKEMQMQAEDVYNANVAQNWGDDEKLKSFTYIGNYLLTNKNYDSSWGSSDNVLFLVYKAQVKDKYTNGGETYNKTNDIYWYIAYYNLLVDPDGATSVDVTNYGTPSESFTIDSGISSGWWSTKSWYYYGYQSLDELYNVVVTSNSESYNHEDNVYESLAVTETQQEDEVIGEEGIIFPNSSVELLSEDDIKELSDENFQFAINELYARRGYIFKDDTLREYYEQFEWYEPEVKPDDFSMDLFNDIEKGNLELLQKERDSRN